MSLEKDSNNPLLRAQRLLKITSLLAVIAVILFVLILVNPNVLETIENETDNSATAIETIDDDIVENGIHLRTGFIAVEGYMTVVNNCTNCHSSKLVIQNRMNADRWNTTIQWMQETQNLWDLGEQQAVIVNYLVKNYPPVEKGRRENLANVEWYELVD